MRKVLLLTVLTTITTLGFAQNDCQYLKKEKVLKVISEQKFKPFNKLKGNEKELKKVVLAMDQSGRAWNQMCIDSWYICDRKSDDFFQIWLIDYPRITREYWESNCHALVFLMTLDTPSLMDIMRK